MENPIKMDDLGVPLFLETPIYYVDLLGTNELLNSGVHEAHMIRLQFRESPGLESLDENSQPFGT